MPSFTSTGGHPLGPPAGSTVCRPDKHDGIPRRREVPGGHARGECHRRSSRCGWVLERRVSMSGSRTRSSSSWRDRRAVRRPVAVDRPGPRDVRRVGRRGQRRGARGVSCWLVRSWTSGPVSSGLLDGQSSRAGCFLASRRGCGPAGAFGGYAPARPAPLLLFGAAAA